MLSTSVLSTSGSSVLASSSRSSLHATLENVMRLLEERRKKEERPENIEVCRKGPCMREGGREEEGGRGGLRRKGNNAKQHAL